MEKIKGFLKIIILIIIPLAIVTSSLENYSYAANYSSGVYFNLYNGPARPTGTYRVLTGQSEEKNVIKIIETNSSGTAQTVETRNAAVYCLKNGVGFGLNNDGIRSSVKYTEYFYLNDQNDGLYTNSSYSTYRSVLPGNASGTNYNKLLWLLNNICRPEDTTSKNNLLKSAASYNNLSKLDFSVYQVPGKTSTEVEKDIIEVVQQAAIWYFTNPTGNYHPFFDSESGGNFYLNGTALEDHARTSSGGSIGLLPTDVPHLALYKYLIETAERNGSYKPQSSGSPLTFDKARAVVTTTDTGFLIGPYKLSGNVTGVNNLSATITDGNYSPLSVTLLGENKYTQLSGSSIADKIKNNINKDFYISVPLNTNINTVQINVGANFTRKVVKYWSVPANSALSEQPVVVIKEESSSDSWSDIKKVEKPEFDLALRKFITQIKDKNGTSRTFASREPQYTQSELKKLADGTTELDSGKTLKKEHTKDPLLVETGDTVVYTIRIYNEGQVDGKATEITDYLPTGLELKEGSTINQRYGWTKDSSNSRAIKTVYLKNTNLAHFNTSTNTINYADVQVECTVTAKNEANNKNLKNVAEITEFSNTGNYPDRDSQVPNVNHNDTNSNYTGTQNRIGKGEQDDDDYEELILEGKYFDLSLRKHISAVNDTTYNRAPVVDVATLKNGQTTATYKHRKDAITVSAGDIVTYTINIYNEGQVDGYAQKVVDHLPEYLEFISDTSSSDTNIRQAAQFNQSYGWTIDTTDRNSRTIYTTNLSKENSTSNIIKAFDTSKNNLETPKELKIKCKVKNNAPELIEITNIAEIAEYYNELGLPDRDNRAKVTLPEDANLPNYKGHTDNNSLDEANPQNYFKGQEDDDDFEKVILKTFDLALRKFITQISDKNGNARTFASREPKFDQNDLKALADGTAELDGGTTLKKQHSKDPLPVETGDSVVYTIRIYNEGQIDGKATEITDYLPTGLELKEESTINQRYGWKKDSSNSRAITTTYLKDTNLAHFNKTPANGQYTISYADVQVECTVVAKTSSAEKKLKNVAEITNSFNDENYPDRDSQVNNVHHDDDNSNYEGTQNRIGKGEQDDDDYEELVMQGKYFDLALRKHISAVNDTPYNRAPVIDVTPLKRGEDTATYKHRKDTVSIGIGDIVTYTINVYNEGQVDGYVQKVVDHLPEYLEFISDTSSSDPKIKAAAQFNVSYGWTIDESDSSKRTIYTTKLSKENSASNILKAFNPTKDSLEEPKELKIKCKVKDNAPELKEMTNIAEITEYYNELELPDRDNKAKAVLPADSELPNYRGHSSNKDLELANKESYFKGQEDDDDFEKVILKKFDLALRKFITQINDKNGASKTFESREPKFDQNDLKALADGTAELDGGTTLKKQHSKDPLPVESGDTVIYTIRVYNEGQIDGKAKEITDYLPTGLELKEGSTINQKYGWTTDSSNSRVIKTTYLKDTNLEHFNRTPENGVYTISYADIQVECIVSARASSTNKNLKNVAEITKSSNEGNYPDRDSQEDNVHHDDTNSNYEGTQNPKGKGEQDDDDYEDLVILGKYFDLSLRKHISAVNDTPYNRTPVIDVTPLKNGEDTAIYKHRKDPISISLGDIITYTINIYNEGQVDGYAQKVVDHLPEYLEFIDDPTSTDQKIKEATEFNKQYGWTVDESDSLKRTIYTTKLSKENSTDNIIKAFDQTKNNLEAPKELKIKCRVKNNAPALKVFTNIAEITDYFNELGLSDRDNEEKAKLPSDSDLPNYKGHTDNKNLDEANSDNYFKGQEDDDDYEKVILRKFDLALKKFIASVNENELKTNGVYDRAPTIDTSKYGTIVEGKEITTFEYSFKQNPPKDPVRVEHNDIVTYIIRVYNEGSKSGYAAELKDDIPEGLEFLPENPTNTEYKWVMLDENGDITTDVKQAKSIRTDYLSKENGKPNTKGISGYDKENSNLLLAYDAETMGQNPDYADVKVAFKVALPKTSDRIVINKAQISNDKDENNEDVIDIDSTPDKWIDEEDDQDIEKIYIKYFDLSLRKWVTHAIVIEDGVQKEMETGHYAEQEPEPAVKVEVNEKRMTETVIKFRYSIRVTNEGEIDGYATEISDYIPKGLKFNQADNPNWKEENGKITTEQLKDTLLKPGESATVELILTWINDENNMGVMTNWAEISKDKNDSDTPDIDSIPNNRKEEEDDMDYAPVVLAVIAGIAQKYIAITGGAFVIIAIGVFLIKKFIL